MTEAVIERVDEMSSRVDELEKNIQDLMVQVPPKPVERLTTNPCDSFAARNSASRERFLFPGLHRFYLISPHIFFHRKTRNILVLCSIGSRPLLRNAFYFSIFSPTFIFFIAGSYYKRARHKQEENMLQILVSPLYPTLLYPALTAELRIFI